MSLAKEMEARNKRRDECRRVADTLANQIAKEVDSYPPVLQNIILNMLVTEVQSLHRMTNKDKESNKEEKPNG